MKLGVVGRPVVRAESICNSYVQASSVRTWHRGSMSPATSDWVLGPGSKSQVSGLGSQVVGFRLQFLIPWFYIHRSQVLVRGLKVKVLGSPKISSWFGWWEILLLSP